MTEVAPQTELVVPVTDIVPPIETTKNVKEAPPRSRRRSPTTSTSRSRSRTRSLSRRGRYQRSRSRDNGRRLKNSRFSRIERRAAPSYKSRQNSRPWRRSPFPLRRNRPSFASPDNYSSRNNYRRTSPSTNRNRTYEKTDVTTSRINRNTNENFEQSKNKSRSHSPLLSNYHGDTNRTTLDAYNPPPPPSSFREDNFQSIVLNDRFYRLIDVASRRRPEYGIAGGFAHLVLSNKLQIPLPTLMRQAKELSVIIERQLPAELSNPNGEIIYEYNPRRGPLVFPRAESDGLKPVFDRPELPLYQKPEDEEAIIRRLAAVMSASNSENKAAGHTSNYNKHEHSNFSRTMKNSAFTRLGVINPFDTPKGGYFFQHDDRDGRTFQPQRSKRFSRWNGWRRGYDYNDRDYKNKSRNYQFSHSPEYDENYSRKSREPVQKRWTHDKYFELKNDDEKNSTLTSPPHADNYSPDKKNSQLKHKSNYTDNTMSETTLSSPINTQKTHSKRNAQEDKDILIVEPVILGLYVNVLLNNLLAIQLIQL